jgi:hypothetical protein
MITTMFLGQHVIAINTLDMFYIPMVLIQHGHRHRGRRVDGTNSSYDYSFINYPSLGES